jgi:F-type H+-transporting ATPase subunit epsilon
MADLLELEIATPERQLVREQVADVQIPGNDGYLGILPGHAALLGQLGAGALSYAIGGGQRRYLAIDGGFLEVLEDHVRVLPTRPSAPKTSTWSARSQTWQRRKSN